MQTLLGQTCPLETDFHEKLLHSLRYAHDYLAASVSSPFVCECMCVGLSVCLSIYLCVYVSFRA